MEIQMVSTLTNANSILNVALHSDDQLVISIVNSSKFHYKRNISFHATNSQYFHNAFQNINSFYQYIKQNIQNQNVIQVNPNHEVQISLYKQQPTQQQKLTFLIETIKSQSLFQCGNFNQQSDNFLNLNKYNYQRLKKTTLELQSKISNTISIQQSYNLTQKHLSIIQQHEQQIYQQTKLISWQTNQLKRQTFINQQHNHQLNKQKQQINTLFKTVKSKIHQIQQQTLNNKFKINQINKEKQEEKHLQQKCKNIYLSPFSQVYLMKWNQQSFQQSSQLNLNPKTNIIRRKTFTQSAWGWFAMYKSLKCFKQVFIEFKIIKLNLMGRGIPFGVICKSGMDKGQVFNFETLLYNPIGRIWNGLEDSPSQITHQNSVIGLLFEAEQRIVSWFSNMKLIQRMRIPDQFFQQEIFAIAYMWEVNDKIQLI